MDSVCLFVYLHASRKQPLGARGLQASAERPGFPESHVNEIIMRVPKRWLANRWWSDVTQTQRLLLLIFWTGLVRYQLPLLSFIDAPSLCMSTLLWAQAAFKLTWDGDGRVTRGKTTLEPKRNAPNRTWVSRLWRRIQRLQSEEDVHEAGCSVETVTT